jgi:hypothetical protein
VDRHRLTLQDWVTKGNPLQRLHAGFRLAQPNPPRTDPDPARRLAARNRLASEHSARMAGGWTLLPAAGPTELAALSRPAAGADPADWNANVAPLAGEAAGQRPWEGRQTRKPREYRVTAAIVHRDTPDLLAGAVACLRAQTERPYILVVDMGSGEAARATLAELERGDDLEVSTIRSRSWVATSQPVTAGMDLAFTLCQTPYLYATHVDVFLKRPDYLSHLLSLCDERTPAVGWQMSPRPNWPTDEWKSTLSHTASIYHMKMMRTLGVTWNLLSAMERLGLPLENPSRSFPDTETNPSLTLNAAGITPRWVGKPDDGGRHILFLGTEPNEPYETEWFEHVRSSGIYSLYWPASEDAARRRVHAARALAAIPDRLRRWAAPPDPTTPTEIRCHHRHPIAGCTCFHCDRFHRRAPVELCEDCEWESIIKIEARTVKDKNYIDRDQRIIGFDSR